MLKLLIVDDSRAVHAFLKTCLPENFAQRKSVMNGQEALAAVGESRDFDLILLDWEMPVLNGPSTVTELKKMGVAIPILVMTTRSNVEDIIKMMELGANEYMFKPFTKDILIEKMELAMNRKVDHVA